MMSCRVGCRGKVDDRLGSRMRSSSRREGVLYGPFFIFWFWIHSVCLSAASRLESYLVKYYY